MTSVTRFDVVLRAKDTAEKARRRELEAALGRLDHAKTALEQAEEEAARIPSSGGAAWLVDTFERAHERSVERVASARANVAVADTAAATAREVHTDARRAQRGIEKLVEAKRALMRLEAEKREQRALDDLAVMRA